VADRTAALEGLLAQAVASPLKVDFESLKWDETPEPFDPQRLDQPLRAPTREQFQPRRPYLPGWFPGQRAARERSRAGAAAAYRQAVAAYRTAEFDRVRQLSNAHRAHERRTAVAAERARTHNAAVDRLRDDYWAGESAAIERYTRIALSGRSWPDGVQVSWRLRYRPELRQLDVECVLPGRDIVPRVRRFRYVAAVDAMRRQLVPEHELRDRYALVVAQIVLCALFDLFQVLDKEVVDVIRLDARMQVTGGGDPAMPHVASVAVSRADWTARLDEPWSGIEDPHGLVHRLGAWISADPYASVSVGPWTGLDAVS
jgi:hypothetical protein